MLSVRLYVYSFIVAKQRLGKNFAASTNAHVTIEESLDASVLFAVRVVSRKLVD
jgi:hypothetical protein